VSGRSRQAHRRGEARGSCGRTRPRGRSPAGVTDASGSPLPGLVVELFEKGGDKPARSATTDGEGRFIIMDVSAGTLTVRVRVGDRIIEKKVSR